MDISNNKIISYGNKKATSLDIFGKTEDYVPLFTMYRPDLEYNRGSYLNTIFQSPRITWMGLKMNRMSKGNRLDRIISQKFADAFNNIINKNPNLQIRAETEFFAKYLKVVSTISDNIKDHIYNNSWSFVVKKDRYVGNSYYDVFDNLVNKNQWGYARLRIDSYITNSWYLAHFNSAEKVRSKSVTTLCCMVVKHEMLPYIRLCSLLGESPHPDALELWVRKGFDVPKGDFKNIRTHYRKNVRKVAIDSGIKIVTVPCIDSLLFHTYKPKKVKSIADLNRQKREISREFVASKVVEITMKRNNIASISLT